MTKIPPDPVPGAATHPATMPGMDRLEAWLLLYKEHDRRAKALRAWYRAECEKLTVLHGPAPASPRPVRRAQLWVQQTFADLEDNTYPWEEPNEAERR